MFGNPDVTIHTDHRPLEPIFQKPLNKAPKRLQSMLMALQRYPMKLCYRPGKEQVTADMLSRAPVGEPQTGIPTEQIFTVNQLRSFMSDLTTTSLKKDLPVSEATYKKIQQNTSEDPVMMQLQSLISSGWPEKIGQLSEDVKPYFSYKDELAVLDGVIYKGSRLVIPINARAEILSKLHTSHQGTAATIRRARGAVFWPQMAEDIKMKTENCVTCALDSPLQQHESLQSHDIPDIPWSKVGMDILTYRRKDYLMLVDYYSDFFECEPLSDMQSRSVIKTCKKAFARYGIPHQLHSDNGPQFVSAEFAKFSGEWGFQHTVSSPGHQQCNGKAEAAVKVIKRLMKRADDPYLALLEYRNTPTAGMSSSPAQRMFGHSTRSILPTATPFGTDVLTQKARKKMVTQKHYNRSAKELDQLNIGSPVLLRDFASQKHKWQQGRVVQQMSDRSYLVSNNATDKAVRRNRSDLRPIAENESNQTTEKAELVAGSTPAGSTAAGSTPAGSTPAGSTPARPAPNLSTTSTSEIKAEPKAIWQRSRQTKMPAKYQPYVLY